jgi:hypothetical protein
MLAKKQEMKPDSSVAVNWITALAQSARAEAFAVAGEE